MEKYRLFASINNTVLYHADSRYMSEFIEPDSIDLVFTDPPYPRKYKYTFQYLADYCPDLMKNGASLVTITPHYLLPEVVEIFKNRLKYRWILNMYQEDGSHPRMAMGIEVMWKPMLWYVKKAYPHGRGFLRDSIRINPPEKKYHEWEQDISWCMYYIQRLCIPGGLVLDPYVGSGTTAIACSLLGLNFIGIDTDENALMTTVERLKNNVSVL
jgi:DNA modification methylase